MDGKITSCIEMFYPTRNSNMFWMKLLENVYQISTNNKNTSMINKNSDNGTAVNISSLLILFVKILTVLFTVFCYFNSTLAKSLETGTLNVSKIKSISRLLRMIKFYKPTHHLESRRFDCRIIRHWILVARFAQYQKCTNFSPCCRYDVYVKIKFKYVFG